MPEKYFIVELKLDVLCYSSRDYPLASAVSGLVIPGLIDQLLKVKESVKPRLSTNHPKVILISTVN